MKKSILNTAITLAMSTALLSGAALNTLALADTLPADSPASDLSVAASINTDQTGSVETGSAEVSTTDTVVESTIIAESITENPATETSLSKAEDNKEVSDKNQMYSGMGVGAIAGTVVAGPVGFVVGGLIGALIGSEQSIAEEDTDELQQTTLAVADDSPGETVAYTASSDDLFSTDTSGEQNTTHDGIQVAQLGAIEPVLDEDVYTRQDELVDILTADLSLDVYFRSGSTDIESFYPARLAAIADLLNTMDSLEIHLDGYTDRRGDKSQNIALANERIETVRQQLIDAGVDESRIISRAFGEMKMVSAPGDLDGYTFDRKVVIRFERKTVDSIHSMKTALSEMDADDVSADVSANDASEISISPVVADAGSRF
ncbi:MAG: OmpA family protein [Proteobacteria bacterium]|nr:OmpA family protein [Pseudomonadota bacterium]